MNSFRKRLHHLADQISDRDLAEACKLLQMLHEDSFMLKAIQDSKESLKPGDSLTYEAALQLLYFEQSRSVMAKPHQSTNSPVSEVTPP